MDGFFGGLALGFLLGLLIGPVLRSWIVWHEIESTRRAAAFADGILARLDRAEGNGHEVSDRLGDDDD